jgi:hypothetical protein
MVQILHTCTHVCKGKNVSVEIVSGRGEWNAGGCEFKYDILDIFDIL